MKRFFIGLTIVIILGLFVGTGYFLYQKSEEPPIIYETDTPFKTDIIKKTIATGSIVPRKEVALKSQVSGVVEKLYLEEGAQVKIGDLVAKIKIIPNVVALNNAQAQLQTAKINFDNSEKELKRQKELFDEKVISEFDYNQFLLDFNLRKQEVEAAENNLELIKEGSSQKTGNVSNLVRSTVNGMILDIPVKEGTFIIESNTFNEGTSIASVADMSEMIFEGKVDESEVGKINVGMDLSLSVGAIEGVIFNAKLEFISPKGESDEGAIKFDIKAAVDLKEEYFLRAGYSATADIILQKASDVLAIKESNLIFEGDDIFVEVRTGEQQFERRQVKTGLSDGINIQIAEGLTEEEVIKKL
ncbi:efflux RND transporter periplasmic adaptor subunit [Marinoscillum sp. 108]|jgi:HlyD family secretion protein|uniref:Efflux RND transporter periplasmic adaptor subunit n=1 Tax=Marinoscillum luteum TaxID=861051 RepID=A0ABW7N6F4_9BACT|nr:efflux RND transporter periplasmic adaptor subunit [Marinoscillum sp. 108]VXD17733.1 Efflux transporter periplasmic adaptor subunit [Marinoscillum sp. 108]